MIIQIGVAECRLKNQKRIALLFDYDKDIIDLIKQIKGRKWSASNKFWHIPYNENAVKKLNIQFNGKLQFIRKKISPKFPPEYLETLKLLNYSEATIKTYKQHFLKFLKHFTETGLENISKDQIREYLLYLVEKKQYSASAQNNVINSLKFYYEQVLQQKIEDYYLPRPKRSRKLPQVLNEQEVTKIFKCINNLRDKCMIFLVYSTGLTPSEVIHIKVQNIDPPKMRIFISSAKGDKDRNVILSKKMLELLREYYKKFKPQKWLFESCPGKQYSKRKLQKNFQIAVQKSKINKPATLTILKNSFAVHLIEKGVDVRFVQQMLGHKHSKTTMKYLKVSKRDLSVIQSPLDNLEL